jgi:hypothetical protein
MCIMVSETIFAVFCIVQCIINFSGKSFVGGSGACDLQAYYATYYTFSSMGLAAYGFAATCYGILSTTPSWVVVGGVGALIHIVSVVLATLPFAGAGSYLFARDYCMHNIESGFFAIAFLIWYVACIAVMLGTILKVRAAEANLSAKSQLVKLLVATTAYFIIFAWSVSLAIVMAWLINGKVYDSSAWRLYGAQAIILHSNQLFVPLLFGGLWRQLMLDTASPSTLDISAKVVEATSKELPIGVSAAAGA